MNFPPRQYPSIPTTAHSRFPSQWQPPQHRHPSKGKQKSLPTHPGKLIANYPISITVTVGIRNGGLELLPHWLCYYMEQCRPCHIRITVIGDSAERIYEVASIVSSCCTEPDVEVSIRTTHNLNVDGHDEQVASLKEISYAPNAWIVWTDLDEFHSMEGGTIRQAIETAHKERRTAIFGTFMDRTTIDGTLASVKPGICIFEQFPVSIEFNKYVIQEINEKILAARWDQCVVNGHHYVTGQKPHGPQGKVFHFKWNAAVWDRLNSYLVTGVGRSHIPRQLERLRNHLSANGGKIRVK